MQGMECYQIHLYVCFLYLVSPRHCLDPGQEETIRTFIEEYLTCSYIPGLALGVVKDGVTEIAAGFGEKMRDPWIT